MPGLVFMWCLLSKSYNRDQDMDKNSEPALISMMRFMLTSRMLTNSYCEVISEPQT